MFEMNLDGHRAVIERFKFVLLNCDGRSKKMQLTFKVVPDNVFNETISICRITMTSSNLKRN